MSASTIVSLVLGFVKFANYLFGWAHDQGIIKAEDDRLFALQIAEMAKRSTTIREIEGRFANMTPEQVSRELEQDFRD